MNYNYEKKLANEAPATPDDAEMELALALGNFCIHQINFNVFLSQQLQFLSLLTILFCQSLAYRRMVQQNEALQFKEERPNQCISLCGSVEWSTSI